MGKAEGRKGLSDAGLFSSGLLIGAESGRSVVASPLADPAPQQEPPGHLGHRARMRQRLLAAGPSALLDHEMLEMVLFLALPRRDTKPIARALLARFGGFAGAIAAPLPELQTVEGLGEAGAAALKL